MTKGMNNIKTEVATFAGGCFWCLQHDLDHIPGVISTLSGYMGGDWVNPSYEEVCSGRTGHLEVVQVTFDPNQVSYEKLLNVFWHSVDPTRSEGQFCDIGPQYRPAIFYHDEKQRDLAEASKREIQIRPNVVEIRPAKTFYPAEDYHQQFYKKSPGRYNSYHHFSGREERLNQLWK